MSRPTFLCDKNCPNVTRSHNSAAAVEECLSRRSRGEISRASALTPRAESAFDITLVAGDDFSGTVVREDLVRTPRWRPQFRGSRLDLRVFAIEGAHLPGADFRGAQSAEFSPGLPLHMMAEARGAIIDDEIVRDATEGDNAWLLASPDEQPQTYDAQTAADYVVPFIQWSFSDTQWQSLLAAGYDPDELVFAAQEFPPCNVAGFKAFMDCGDAVTAESLHPHREAWGERELVIPPRSAARIKQERAGLSRSA